MFTTSHRPTRHSLSGEFNYVDGGRLTGTVQIVVAEGASCQAAEDWKGDGYTDANMTVQVETADRYSEKFQLSVFLYTGQ